MATFTTQPIPFNKSDYKTAVWETARELEEQYKNTPGYTNVKVTFNRVGTPTKTEINNPIKDASPKDAFRLESKDKQFYLRFGYLLEYIAENILPRIKIGDEHSNNPPIFNIDYDVWNTHMYSLPNQISLDPRVCIVRNSNFNSGRGNTQIFQQLPFFREIDNGKSKNPNAAYPLNIYLNFNFILECLKPDDRGDVNIYELISSICTGLNKALGGINNLEPIINEQTNTLQIIDTTPIPGYSSKSTKSYTLQIYGYKNTRYNYSSNFVRNVDLKTAITPEFATMVTIGATAGGYVKGTEATAFSKWNTGLADRFKEEFTPGNLSSVKKSTELDEAEVNYANEFLVNGYVTRYGLTSLKGDFTFNSDAIERNLSVVTEYYKYLIAKESVDQDTSGGTIGFIPFKLNLTLDGISGIKIYNKLQVNTEFLPKAYGKTVDLIVTGISHELSNNDWTTQIETTVIPKTGKQSTVTISEAAIQETIQSTKSNPTGRPSKCPVITFKVNDSSKRETYQSVAKAAKNIFPELSKESIAGLLGVLQHESNFNPTSFNDGGGGCGAIGLAQFRGDRQTRLFAFAEGNNLPVNDVITQLKYLKYELPKYYANLWELLKKKNLTITQYTAIFHISQGLGNSNPYDYYKKITNQQTYLDVYLSKKGPTPTSIPKRLSYAKTILQYLNTL